MIINDLDIEIVWRTVYGEARSLNDTGQQAVAHIIMNRAFKKGEDPYQICLKRKQFSCWNGGDSNYNNMRWVTLDHDAAKRALMNTMFALANLEDDFTNGATHYHTHSITPYWVKGKTPCYSDDGHHFYNDIRF